MPPPVAESVRAVSRSPDSEAGGPPGSSSAGRSGLSNLLLLSCRWMAEAWCAEPEGFLDSRCVCRSLMAARTELTRRRGRSTTVLLVDSMDPCMPVCADSLPALPCPGWITGSGGDWCSESEKGGVQQEMGGDGQQLQLALDSMATQLFLATSSSSCSTFLLLPPVHLLLLAMRLQLCARVMTVLEEAEEQRCCSGRKCLICLCKIRTRPKILAFLPPALLRSALPQLK